MAVWVIPGIIIGILLALYTTERSQRNVKEKLISDYEFHSKNGTVRTYLAKTIAHKAQWIRSLSLLRKPFSRQVNMAIETAALVFAIATLINSITGFYKYFESSLQGNAVLMLLGVIIAYIPSDWLLTGQLERQVGRVLDGLKEAVDNGNPDIYIAEIKRNWK